MASNQRSSKGAAQPKVAVYHRESPMYMGGGETVGIQTIEALKEDYDVTLLTVGRRLNFAELNNYFGTSLEKGEVDVRFIDPHLIGILDSFFQGVARSSKLNTEFTRLRAALLDWSVSRIKEEFELLISTQGESSLCGKSLDYLHFPFDRDSAEKLNPGLERSSEIPLYNLYNRLVSLLKPCNAADCPGKTTLVNSFWTKRLVQEAYNLDVDVLYPPVRTGDFNPPPWDERETGFISVGRISREKNLLRSMDVIDDLSDEYDVHLHVIGDIKDREYGEIVRKRAQRNPAILVEGEVSREKLVELIEEHKFGIHGMDAEHFGIVVAEMVAGGCIPFVPDDGGQVEIVNRNPHLLYSNKNEAVEKISEMLDDKELQKKTIRRLEGRGERFSAERFKRKMKEIVAEKLG